MILGRPPLRLVTYAQTFLKLTIPKERVWWKSERETCDSSLPSPNFAGGDSWLQLITLRTEHTRAEGRTGRRVCTSWLAWEGGEDNTKSEREREKETDGSSNYYGITRESSSEGVVSTQWRSQTGWTASFLKKSIAPQAPPNSTRLLKVSDGKYRC